MAPDDVYGMRSLNASSRRNIVWPSIDEAHRLLDTVLASIGRLQHLFEPRTFSDQLSLRYQGPPVDFDTSDLWHLELALVFALGYLLQGESKDHTSIPGAQLYVEVENRLPGAAALRRQGMVAIEILGLMAFYLQCADRRDDAYIYVR